MLAPREKREIGVSTFGGKALRVWEMRAAAEWPPDEVHDAARPLIESFARAHGGSTGFVLVHAARPAYFVLAHLWDGVDLLQRCWTAPLPSPRSLVPHRPSAIGCVWELEVVLVERARWAAVCDVPDAVGRYLAQRRGPEVPCTDSGAGATTRTSC